MTQSDQPLTVCSISDLTKMAGQPCSIWLCKDSIPARQRLTEMKRLTSDCVHCWVGLFRAPWRLAVNTLSHNKGFSLTMFSYNFFLRAHERANGCGRSGKSVGIYLLALLVSPSLSVSVFCELVNFFFSFHKQLCA